MTQTEFLATIRLQILRDVAGEKVLKETESTIKTMGAAGTKAGEGLRKMGAPLTQMQTTAQDLGKELEGFTIVSAKVGTVYNKNNEQIRKVTSTWQNQQGMVKQVGVTYDKNNKVISRSVQEMTGLNKATKEGQPLMNQFGLAMKRALIVAPVWMIMRSIIMGVIKTFSDGMKYWSDFSEQMMKAKAVIHDAVGSIDQTMSKLSDTIKRMSIETGQSMKDLASAFYRFGTVGLDAETSMLGMEAATKASIAMFGNTDQYAKILALTYRLMGDTIDRAIPPKERMLSISAKLYTLWQKNAFEMDEFTGALQQFLPTANTMNLTLDETLALLTSLHTGALQGSQSGRLLRTSFAKLIENVDGLASSLGLLVDLRVDRPFDVLTAVLDRLETLAQKGDLEKVNQVIAQIFGGVRGGQPIRALSALKKVLKENIDLIDQGRMDEIMEKFKKRVEECTDELSRQQKIMDNLRQQIGMTFVQAVFGGKNFEDSLKNINKFLEEANERIKTFYNTWSAIMSLGIVPFINTLADMYEKTAKASDKLNQALSGEMPLKEIQKYIKHLENVKLKYDEIPQAMRKSIFMAKFYKDMDVTPLIVQNLDLFLNKLREIKRELETSIKLEYTAGGLRDPFEPQIKLPPPIVIELETRLRLEELKEAAHYRKLEAKGVSDIQIAEQKLFDYVEKRVKEYNKSDILQEKITEKLSTQEIISLALAGNYQRILELSLNRIITEDEILEIAKKIDEIEKIREARTKKYADAFRNAMKGGVEELLKGEAAITDFFERLRNKIKDLWAEALAERMMGAMGNSIFEKFGEIFAEIEMSPKKGMEDGGKTAGETIYKNMVDAGRIAGQQIAESMISAGAGVGVDAPGIAPGAVPSSLLRLDSTEKRIMKDIDDVESIVHGTTEKLSDTFGQMLKPAGLKQIAMGGVAGGWQGAAASALSMLPGNWALLGLLPMLFGGSKKQVTSSWQKQMAPDMLSLMLAGGIAPMAHPYPLPESRYFAGRRGTREGQPVITINISKIEGTNEEVAAQIADKVAQYYQSELHRGLNVSYP